MKTMPPTTAPMIRPILEEELEEEPVVAANGVLTLT
jgi:hypothetical protein